MRLTLLMLLACSGGDKDPSRPPGDADTDVDADSDADTDTDTAPTDTEPTDVDTDLPLDTGMDAVSASCVDVGTAGATPPGAYSGSAASWSEDLDATCVDGREEGLIAVDMPQYSQLVVHANMPDNDVQIAVLDSCSDTGTCVAEADNAGRGRNETARVFHDGAATTFYVVLEASTAVEPTDTWRATLERHSYLPVGLEQTCAAARTANPLAPGRWYVGTALSGNDLDMGSNSCSGWDSPGPDAMIAVNIPAGTTLTARIDTPGRDGALYLLTDCAQPSSCLAGADEIGESDTITWTNPGSTVSGYLVVDSYEQADAPTTSWVTLEIQ